MAYRADIDGLRAVAIAPVVLFHAGVPGFAGGFVGVDVFFVISGYLITSLIRADMAEGRFTLTRFYERRIRRIFPALFAVIFACVIAGALLLLPEDLAALGRSAAATALFASNVLFWRESGYFAAPSELKPLLHTWSLAIEEQFYIAYPLVLLLALRFFKERLVAAVALIALASFVACVVVTAQQADMAFFLAPFRAWELALGALAALGALPPLRRAAWREAAAFAGLALIGFSVARLSRADAFPGLNALYPCLGALLVIHAGGSGESRTGRLLAWRPLVLLGLISYSLYLWHWPLLAFLKYGLMREPHGVELVLALAGSLALAWFSWRFIERPFRSHGGSSNGRDVRAFAGAAAAVCLTLALGLGAHQADGWPSRYAGYEPPKIRGREDYRPASCFLEETQSFDAWGKSTSCLIGHGARPAVLLWGDSFAAHYVPGLEDGAAGRAYDFLQLTAYSCPPVLGASIPWAPKCHDFNDHLDRVLAAHPVAAVVLAARWERYWNRQVTPAMLDATIRQLKSRGLKVVLVGQGPSFEFSNPADYVYRVRRDRARAKDNAAINRELRAVAGYDVFFDPNERLCPGGECLLVEDGQFLYMDGGHYSSYGSRRFVPDLLRAMAATVAP